MSSSSSESFDRIAIVDEDRCKPSKCKQECKRSCPVNRIGKECIVVEKTSKVSSISESLCIGCNVCVKKCPYNAIDIINIPKSIEKDTVFRYGHNKFKLHRLPFPKRGKVLGLVGKNGIGKSTALTILSGKLKPNFGEFLNPPEWKEIIEYFRGSDLQLLFKEHSNFKSKFKTIFKPQYIDIISKTIKGTVREVLEKNNQRGLIDEFVKSLELTNVLDREVSQLSGGELQRFAICCSLLQEGDMYIFDEPFSYLDIKQRIRTAQCIRTLCNFDKYVVVVEHDLSGLDYLSDYICCLYGKPGAYGVITRPIGVREGINIFLAGYIPSENMRFRKDKLDFRIVEHVEDKKIDNSKYDIEYPEMEKSFGDFSLTVSKGSFSTSEIIVMLGENGCGKTTMIKMLCGLIKPDNDTHVPIINVSYKPQIISPKFEGNVRELFDSKIQSAYTKQEFITDVIRPLDIEYLYDQPVKQLSGGELQRVAIVLALGKPADVYLIDEPSAYLDSEQRLAVSKVIKRFVLHNRKTAFVIEHDFMMAAYLADKIILFTGIPSIDCKTTEPQSLYNGMNSFLKEMNITLRRDPVSHRPRINKPNSTRDREQKLSNTYFFLDTDKVDQTPEFKDLNPKNEDLF